MTSRKESIIAFPDDYVVIDIETTGMSPKYNDIIEISALKVCHHEIKDRFSSLVHPPAYYFLGDDHPHYIPDFITDLTGITEDMVKDAPKIKDILPDYLHFIGNGDQIVVGHNVSFDINFLKANCEICDLPVFSTSYVDTIRICRKLFPDKHHHRLMDVVTYLDIPYAADQAHRSLYDCEITYAVYRSAQEKILKNFNSFEEFVCLFKRKRYHFDPKTLTPETDDIDETNPFYEKECIFTGKLEKMVRKDAQQLVVNMGGHCGSSVTKKTDFLILGNNDYCKSIKDGKSSKQKKAESLKLKGQDIEVIPEDVFYQMFAPYTLEMSSEENNQGETLTQEEKDQIHDEFYKNTEVDFDALKKIKAHPKSNTLQGKKFCFTGVLSIPRQDAMEAVVARGGRIMKTAGKTLNYLVVGEQSNEIVGKSGQSSKERKVAEHNRAGSHIEVIFEDEFLKLLE